jgi:predicted enzyme related to lactoylglutathione lyase
MMTDPSYILLYVADPLKSAAFYGDLIGKKPVELQATFALFVLDSGVKLGLWQREDVTPAADRATGGSELCFTVADDAAVTQTRADWAKKGLRILQEPATMDFGFTFTAQDSDGHRLRVFARSN